MDISYLQGFDLGAGTNVFLPGNNPDIVVNTLSNWAIQSAVVHVAGTNSYALHLNGQTSGYFAFDVYGVTDEPSAIGMAFQYTGAVPANGYSLLTITTTLVFANLTTSAVYSTTSVSAVLTLNSDGTLLITYGSQYANSGAPSYAMFPTHSSLALVPGRWHYIIMLLDGGNGYSVFVDGVQWLSLGVEFTGTVPSGFKPEGNIYLETASIGTLNATGTLDTYYDDVVIGDDLNSAPYYDGNSNGIRYGVLNIVTLMPSSDSSLTWTPVNASTGTACLASIPLANTPNASAPQLRSPTLTGSSEYKNVFNFGSPPAGSVGEGI